MKILAFVAAGTLLAMPAQAQTPPKRRSSATCCAKPRRPRRPLPSRRIRARAMPSYEQARAADARHRRRSAVTSPSSAPKRRSCPAKDEFLVTPLWTETREDREARMRAAARRHARHRHRRARRRGAEEASRGYRRNIRDLEANIVTLKEKQITAPKDGMLPGVLTDTVASLGDDIEDCQARASRRTRADIVGAKGEIAAALAKSRRRPRRRISSTSCSTACCRATSCASSPRSTPPRSSTASSAS